MSNPGGKPFAFCDTHARSTVKRRVRELRTKRRMTQDGLGATLGVWGDTVRKWESGDQVPNFDVLRRLAMTFEVSIDSLLGHEGF